MSLLGSIGLMCLLFGVVDIATWLVGLPLTSSGWFPVVLLLLAGALFTLEALEHDDWLGQ